MEQQKTPTIAIGKDFMKACFDLPKQTQNKVRSFMDKFQRDPHSSGINLERIANAVDDKLYSVRIDQKYRAIIAYQQSSSVYLLLYVDNHDDAYAWATTRHVEVNPRTKAIQVYEDYSNNAQVQETLTHKQAETRTVSASEGSVSYEKLGHVTTRTAESDKSEAETSKPVLSETEQNQHAPSSSFIPEQDRTGALSDQYKNLTDEDMLSFGVPDIYIPVMKLQTNWQDFLPWSRRLPDDARVYLQLVAEGQPVGEVKDLLDEGKGRSSMLGLEKTIPAKNVEQPSLAAEEDDFRNALADYATQQSFVVVNGEHDLKRLFDAPLEQWRVFLHPSQRQYVERTWHGPFRLLGGAGTGKTVVAMHRAKRLAADLVRERSSKKVLFTTYSSTLATDIQANLRMICTNEELRRIDVRNLDKFVYSYLAEQGYGYTITYEDNLIKMYWRQAIDSVASIPDFDVSVSFLQDEWRQVIVPQQVISLPKYLRASRLGRGTRLSRMQKAEVWQIVEAYQRIMKKNKVCDIDMAMEMVSEMLTSAKVPRRYAHIVVDEGQDFSAPAYRILRALVEEHDDDIFIVGDAKQRIYGRTVVLSKCGIAIRGRARNLKINYRTTEETRAAADRIFQSSGKNVADEVFAALEGKNDAPSDEQLTFDDLNGQIELADDSRSLISGPTPVVRRFAGKREEFDFVEQWILEKCGTPQNTGNRSPQTNQSHPEVDPDDVCVVLRENGLADKWAEKLDEDLSYGVYRLNKDEEDRNARGIRVSTMHRVKGLEFDYVILAEIDDGICPPDKAIQTASDAVALRELYKQERSLIYVALTRARKEAVVVGCGKAE